MLLLAGLASGGEDGPRLLADVSALVAQATAKAKAALQLEPPGNSRLGTTAREGSMSSTNRTAAAKASSPKAARTVAGGPRVFQSVVVGGAGRSAGRASKASPSVSNKQQQHADVVVEGRPAVAAGPYRAEARVTVAPFWRTNRGGFEGTTKGGRQQQDGGGGHGGAMMSMTQMGRATTAGDVYEKIARCGGHSEPWRPTTGMHRC